MMVPFANIMKSHTCLDSSQVVLMFVEPIIRCLCYLSFIIGWPYEGGITSFSFCCDALRRGWYPLFLVETEELKKISSRKEKGGKHKVEKS